MIYILNAVILFDFGSCIVWINTLIRNNNPLKLSWHASKALCIQFQFTINNTNAYIRLTLMTTHHKINKNDLFQFSIQHNTVLILVFQFNAFEAFGASEFRISRAMNKKLKIQFFFYFSPLKCENEMDMPWAH